jgi:hypothetical protein
MLDVEDVDDEHEGYCRAVIYSILLAPSLIAGCVNSSPPKKGRDYHRRDSACAHSSQAGISSSASWVHSHPDKRSVSAILCWYASVCYLAIFTYL